MELVKAIKRVRKLIGKSDFSLRFVESTATSPPKIAAKSVDIEVHIALDAHILGACLDGVHLFQAVQIEPAGEWVCYRDSFSWGKSKIKTGEMFDLAEVTGSFVPFENWDQMHRVTHAAADKEEGAMLHCVHIRPDVVEACNRWRVARCFADFPVSDSVLIKADVLRGWDMSANEVSMCVEENRVSFRMDDTLLVVPRMHGVFGKCHEALPVKDAGFVTVVTDTEAFLAAAIHAKRVSSLPRLTHLQLHEGSLVVFGSGFEDRLPLIAGSAKLTMEGVSVNSEWLVDALKECQTARTLVGFGAVLMRLESGNYHEGLWLIDLRRNEEGSQ